MRRWLRRIAAPARPAPVPARLGPASISPYLLPSLLPEAQFKRGLRAAAAVRQGDLGYNERHAYFVR